MSGLRLLSVYSPAEMVALGKNSKRTREQSMAGTVLRGWRFEMVNLSFQFEESQNLGGRPRVRLASENVCENLF